MAHASARPLEKSFLPGEKLSFQQSPYSLEIVREGDAVLGTVADEHSSISRPFGFAFGEGIVGRTYLYQWQGNWFESRVSYYSALHGLDLTTGHPHSVPSDLEQALGRRLEFPEVQKCFGCHTTASMTSSHFDPNRSLAGITCEACHGPGGKHVRAIKIGQIDRAKKSILNPLALTPASSVDFCGACHRTSGDVILMNTQGAATVRFQPFRLEESRCWSRSNGNLTCIGCHDPHQSLVRETVFYDRVCLRCHSQDSKGTSKGAHVATVCSEGRQGCVACHMPKVEIPEMHHAFTDHWIRIVKNDAPYPN
jgi:predicted CXXCH cytochrome family protein